MQVPTLNQAAAQNIAEAARDVESLLQNSPRFEETPDITLPDVANEFSEAVILPPTTQSVIQAAASVLLVEEASLYAMGYTFRVIIRDATRGMRHVLNVRMEC